MTDTAAPPLPDQRFWQQYSPNAELPIAGLSSLAWHVVWPVLLVVLGYVIAWNRPTDMAIEPVVVGEVGDPGTPGGGGGSLMARSATDNAVESARTDELPRDLAAPTRVMAPTPLPAAVASPNFPQADDTADTRPFDKVNDAIGKLEDAGRGGAPSAGQGGPGTGGGTGSGNGPGTGAGAGPGSGGTGSVRGKRQVRWRILLSTASGEDYLQTLSALGAVLVMKNPQTNQEEMFRSLAARPVPGEPVDTQLVRSRIMFTDDDSRSARELAAAMGVRYVPDSVRVCYSPRVEETLVRKEREFRGKREEDIYSTTFQIQRNVRTGEFDIFVVEQKLN